jgi:L-ascorbate metabolism protein UlaG (beta-lactamase superfamily)
LERENMAKLLFQGHGSLRFTLNDGRVLYLDPFAGKGYDIPADFILVTHDHFDHNKVDKPAKKGDCKIITWREALVNGEYKIFDFDGLKIEATGAYNQNHNKDECVGFILNFDGLKIYCTGDTGITEQMKTFADRHFDYAIFNTDNRYTIPFEESAKIAEAIGAKYNIPIHLSPVELFAPKRAEKWTAPNKLIVKAGQEIEL